MWGAPSILTVGFVVPVGGVGDVLGGVVAIASLALALREHRQRRGDEQQQ